MHRSVWAEVRDRWAPSGKVVLDGTLERNQFPPWLMAILWPLTAVLLFHFLITPIALTALLVSSGTSLTELTTNLQSLIAERIQEVLTANTIGQIFALAVPAWLVTKLHTRDATGFLRLRAPDPLLLGLSVLGLIALTPVVQWLGTINQHLPLPEWWQAIEQSQMDLIERAFTGDLTLAFALLMIAVTPAICEELLFRGYVQREAERSMGIVGGLIFTGVLFGFYHLRLTQIVPLSLLGVYLAYITWRTGSLWPAVVVHFLNNGFAVVVATYAARSGELTIAEVEEFEVPLYAIVGGVVLIIVVLRAMQQRAHDLLGQRSAHRPSISTTPEE
jgi:membrane protease YdiL (CAAX protease family)